MRQGGIFGGVLTFALLVVACASTSSDGEDPNAATDSGDDTGSEDNTDTASAASDPAASEPAETATDASTDTAAGSESGEPSPEISTETDNRIDAGDDADEPDAGPSPTGTVEPSPEDPADVTTAYSDPAEPTSEQWASAVAAATPIAESDFCSAFELAVCDALQACCANAERKFADRTACLAAIDACEDSSVLDLLTPYDPQRAGALLDVFRNSTGECGIPQPRLYFDETPPPPPPTLTPSAPSGSCGLAPCGDGHFCENETCLARREQGAECDKDYQCVDGLSCRATTLDADLTCEPPASSGGLCVIDEHCEEGLLCLAQADGQSCLLQVDVGEACFSRRDCISGVCIGSACAACENNDACVSGSYCVDGACLGGRDVFGVFADGTPCDYSQNCRSGFCAAEVCLTPTPDEVYCR